jgi:hypothetical protein
MARFRSRAGAPRKLGPWLFAGVFVTFWLLLAISGMDRFKAKDGDSRQYTVPAAQLQGVTRLRIEGDSDDAQGYVPPTRVVLSNTSDITLSLHLRREGRRKGARAQERPGWHAEPPLTVVREGDTLVLRWKPRELPQNAETSDVQDQWIGKIKLPKHFQGLALSHALVEALEPVERLQVSGRSVEVRGEVAHLDLQSTQCGRCAAGGPASADTNDAACDERATKGKNPLLEVSAKNMQSVRIEAWEGNVKVGDTERLKQLDLQLGDHVALLVDRVAVLRLPRGVDGNAGQARGVLPAGDCVVAPALQGDPARSHPLDLLRMPDSPLVAK